MSNWQNFFSNLPSTLKFLFILCIGVGIGVSFNDKLISGLIVPEIQPKSSPIPETPDDNSVTVNIIVRDDNDDSIKSAKVELLYGDIPQTAGTDDNGYARFLLNNPVDSAQVLISKVGFVNKREYISLKGVKGKKEHYINLETNNANGSHTELKSEIEVSPISTSIPKLNNPTTEQTQNTQILQTSKVFDFVANLEKCTLQNRIIKCFFSFKNSNEENTSFRVHLDWNSTYKTLLLAEGQDYVPSRVRLGMDETRGNSLNKVIIGKEDYDLEITFENVDIKKNVISRLLISCWDRNKDRAVKFDFQDIPISL